MRWRYLAQVAALALAYYVAAQLGLLVPVMAGNVSPLYPATGIGLLGILLFGKRVWPAITLGAVAATAPGNSISVTLGVAVAKTVEATLAAYLMRRFAGFERSIDRLQDVLGLVLSGVVSGSAVGATMGVASLCLGGVATWQAFGSLWRVWWVGDAMGVLLVVPFGLAWTQPVRFKRDLAGMVELAALSLLLLFAGELAFGGLIASPVLHLPLAYLPFPFVIWAALRFGQRGAVTGAQVVSLQAIVGTAQGYGPFERESVLLSIVLLQAFLATLFITALAMGAVTNTNWRIGAALRRSHEQSRDLAGKLIVAQEEERRRLSGEIHDGLNQKLAALSFEIGKLRGRLPEDRELMREQLSLLQTRTASVIDDARKISHQLHPTKLEYLGLAAALKSYCAEFGKEEHVRARLTLADVPDPIPPEVALCVYRVAQEGLCNVARHSGAREVRVTLVGSGDGIELSIVDTGLGFEAPQPRRRNVGLGLVSMEERVRLLGGELQIDSAPQAGTYLRLRVPVSAKRTPLDDRETVAEG